MTTNPDFLMRDTIVLFREISQWLEESELIFQKER